MGDRRDVFVENKPIRGVVENDKVSGRDVPGGVLNIFFRNKLDPVQLGDSIVRLLDGHCIGYAAQLRQNGKVLFERHAGWARMPTDGGALFTQSTVMTIASAGKVFTGLAAVRLLEDEGFRLDPSAMAVPDGDPLPVPIAPYLPAAWPRHREIEALTFYDLLNHQSGLGAREPYKDKKAGEVDWARRVIQKGPDGPGDYCNVNYILLRILIHEMLNRRSKAPASAIRAPPFDGHTIPNWEASDVQLQDASAVSFDRYLQTMLFAPAGATASLKAPDDRAWHYHWPYDGEHFEFGDIDGPAGSGGWYMSANGLLRAAAAVRRKGTLLSPERAREAFECGIGVWGSYPTPLGTVHCKGGSSIKSGTKGQELTQGTGLYLLPEGMELVVMSNSNSTSAKEWFLHVIELINNAIRPWSLFTGFR